MNSSEQIESAEDQGTIVVDDQPVIIPPCDHAESSREEIGTGYDTLEDGTERWYATCRCGTCGHLSVAYIDAPTEESA